LYNLERRAWASSCTMQEKQTKVVMWGMPEGKNLYSFIELTTHAHKYGSSKPEFVN